MLGYWISSHPGLSGYPSRLDESLGEDLAQRIKEPASIKTEDIYEAERTADGSLPAVARLVIRDRLGFRYERIVGNQDFVSRQEAAYLLGASLMSVGRWVRAKKLPSQTRKRNGKKYSVVKVADVWRLANELHLRVPEGRTLTIVGTADDSGERKRPQKRG